MNFPKLPSLPATSGAVFLMATSAIGPGFLTQTAFFTSHLKASFGFVILVSVLLDLVVQLNIWRILVAGQKKAPELVESALPGAGHFLSALVVTGGLAFNIGNLAGAALGLQVLFGAGQVTGALISTSILILVLSTGKWLNKMDGFVFLLGIVMLLLTGFIAILSMPPMGEVLYRSINPVRTEPFAILTLLGGTVGGYISYAGGHRLLDAGIRGSNQLRVVNRSAVAGILIASLMRILLFLAAWGVISDGRLLLEGNPAASVFELAYGWLGYKLFGLVMWSAAVTSVVGASYTSLSFARGWHPYIARNERNLILLFILVSCFLFVLFGKPVKILVLAGTINGFILPLSLGAMLWVVYRKPSLFPGYKHPLWLGISGFLVLAGICWVAIRTFSQ